MLARLLSQMIFMKQLFVLLILLANLCSCSGDSQDLPETNLNPAVDNQGWSVPIGLINGSDRPFALAKDPVLFPIKNIEFISDDLLVAVVNMGGETRVYPYHYLSKFESVNDQIGDISYSMTYCPITQSALVLNRDFRNVNFTLRASGYLLNDNVILWDEASESYWSQMLVECIKGPYTGQYNETFNFVEMPWKTVRENFPDAMVFSNTSISVNNVSATSSKTDIPKGDLVYGIIGQEVGRNNKMFIYHFDDFEKGTVLYTPNISGEKSIVVGNKNYHYITSYINDSTVSFEAVQDQFPVVMKDSDGNTYNVFGKATDGPRKGHQLQSHTGFFALLWAFEKFYDDVTFVE